MSEPRRCDCTRVDSPEGELWMAVSEHEVRLEAAKQAAVHHQVGISTPVTFNVLPGLRQTLKAHYLTEITCDHEHRLDRPACSCSLVDLGWHPSVGAAVDAWIDHVTEIQDPKRHEREAELARLRAIEQAAREFAAALTRSNLSQITPIADALRTALAAQDETGGNE